MTAAEKIIYFFVVTLSLLAVALALSSPEAFQGNQAVYQQF